EVDDDDAADVAQAQLADDLLGRLKVVLRDGLFEVAAGSDELARVDVDDRHRLGAVDDERAARRQPGLAVERLLDLLRDAEFVERVVLALVLLDALEEVGSDRLEVSGDRVVRLAALDDHLLEVFVEDIAHDLDEQIGLRVEHRGRVALLDLLLDVLPLLSEVLHVARELLLRRALRRRAYDDAGVLGQHLLEDLLETRALGVRQLARDAVHGSAGHVDQVAAGQRDLARQASALVAHGILRDLHEDLVTLLEGELDATRLVARLDRIPVDLARVEHGVAAAADVDGRGLHPRKHVLPRAR